MGKSCTTFEKGGCVKHIIISIKEESRDSLKWKKDTRRLTFEGSIWIGKVGSGRVEFPPNENELMYLFTLIVIFHIVARQITKSTHVMNNPFHFFT